MAGGLHPAQVRYLEQMRAPRPARRQTLLAVLAVTVALGACAEPGAAPGDRPDAEGCAAFFNDLAVGASEADATAFVGGQSRWEWNGERAVCWVTLFEPECTVWSAMEPDWEWRSEPLPGGDCDPEPWSDVGHRLTDGQLVSR